MNCVYFREEETGPPAYFRGAELVNHSRGGEVHQFIDFLFLPNIYAYIQCSAEIDITYLDPQKVDVKASFVLENNSATNPQHLTAKDSWKTSFYPAGYEDTDDVHPLMGLAAPGGTLFSLKEDDIQLRPVGAEVASLTHWIVAAPFQRPYNIRGTSLCEVGYTFVKNAMIFARLQFGVTYSVSARLYHVGADYSGVDFIQNTVGALFPFGRVELRSVRHSGPPGLSTDVVSYDTVAPRLNDSYPGEEEGESSLSFSPCNGNESVIVGAITNRDGNAIGKTIAEQGPLCAMVRTRYEVSNGVVGSVLAPDRTFNPTLVPRLRAMSGDGACPVHICMTNLRDSSARVNIEVREQTRGEDWRDVVTLPSKSERVVPLELSGLQGRSPGDGTLFVTISEGGELIHEETQAIHLLPSDHLLLSIQDPAGKRYYRTVDAVVCWVTPQEDLIDRWTGAAKARTPSKSLPGGQGPWEPQIRALWEVLEDRGVSYVDRSYSIGSTDEAAHQRVQTPRRTLELQSGNCIDLSVLFASALEQLSMNPRIVLVPGHAFVGWAPTGQEHGYLETTLLGRRDLEEALAQGRSTYENVEQEFGEQSKPGFRELDVTKLRSSGLHPLF